MCEENQQALVVLTVLKTLCLEQIKETPIIKIITMKNKITLAAALVMTVFTFCSTSPANAGVFAKLDGVITADMLCRELLEGDPDRSSSYSEVESVYMTLRVLGFHEDEAVMGLVLMSEGLTLDETVWCLTTENSIANPNLIAIPNILRDRSSGEIAVGNSLSQGALR